MPSWLLRLDIDGYAAPMIRLRTSDRQRDLRTITREVTYGRVGRLRVCGEAALRRAKFGAERTHGDPKVRFVCGLRRPFPHHSARDRVRGAAALRRAKLGAERSHGDPKVH